MTPDQLAQLTEVNRRINLIPYNAQLGVGEPADFTTDTPVPGWSFVCRMYTQTKSKELKALGWSDDDLWTVICWTEHVAPPISDNSYSGRERHEVLEVRIDGETWILDSRFADPYLWTKPPTESRE